jgi:hypothetical protein
MNEQFFDKVLPTQGNICVVGIKGDSVRPKFSEYLSEAIDFMKDFDAGDFNTFFALGTFEGYQRKASACIFMRSFFVDLDCGPDKPYAAWEDGLIGLHKFLSTTELPKPIIVNSGNGIHAYWPFTSDVPTDIWKPYAEKFKQYCLDNGLMIDEVVTADAARILRVPGSRNLKRAPLPVEVIQDAEPTNFEDWEDLLGKVEKAFDLSQVEKGLDDETQALFDKMNGNYEYVFQKLAEDSLEGVGCGQIKYILENAASCPEPLWYAGLSVASRCVDGNTAIHLMSEDHPDYSRDETERKAEQSRSEAAWAHSCDAFERENRSGCAGCPHKGKLGKSGPIALARSIKLAVEYTESSDGTSSDEGDEAPNEAEPTGAKKDPKNLLVFPEFLKPFFRPINGGVYFQPPPRMNKDGKKVQDPPEMLTPNDVYPIQRLFSPHDGECLVMRLHLPRDASREFMLPLKDIGALDKLKATLLSNGVAFEPTLAPKFASYLMKWTSYLINTQKADIMRIQQGWTDDHESFVLGTNEVFKDEIRHCPPSPMSKNIVRYVKKSGTFDGWLKAARMLNDPGYEFHAFTLLCGFATPLMEFSNVNGIVLSLHGESGVGKTGALYSAMSIWGSPESLTVNDATPNALTQRMITSKNITFGLDEQTNLDGKVASDVVYKTSAGRPKIRLQASSNQERESEFITRLIAIITTNNSLIDIISTYKANTSAEEMRILEPFMTRPNVHGYELTLERGKEMFDAYHFHYGHAGEPYVQELLKVGKKELTRRIHIEYMNVADKYSKSGEYRYIASLIANVYTAERILRELGWFEFDMVRIMNVVGGAFNDIISGKRKADSNTREDVLGDFINKNIQNMLVVNNGKVSTAPRGPLYIRAEVEESTIFVSTSALKAYLHEIKLGIKEFETKLTDAGVMKGKLRKQMAAGWSDAVGSTNVQAYAFETDLTHLIKPEQENEQETTE